MSDLIDLYVKVLVKIRRTINGKKEFQEFRTEISDILKYKETGPQAFINNIGITREWNEKIYSEILQSAEYLLGEFDQDGYLLSCLPVHSVSTIDKDHFLPRKKFSLFFVSVYGRLGVKKDYRGDSVSFFNELKIYSKLLGKNINIPVILEVNYDFLSITFSYIRGLTIRESLYNIGAVFLNRDIEANPEMCKIPDENRWIIQTDNKSGSLYGIIDSRFVENLFLEIEKIHDCNIFIDDIKYGNIIAEDKSNKPYLIDFESSRDISAFGKYIKKIQKNRDIELFNSLFFTKNNGIKTNQSE
jgi:serine/threonine protein kinase